MVVVLMMMSSLANAVFLCGGWDSNVGSLKCCANKQLRTMHEVVKAVTVMV
jgi:hypothetical protein